MAQLPTIDVKIDNRLIDALADLSAKLHAAEAELDQLRAARDDAGRGRSFGARPTNPGGERRDNVIFED